MKERIRKRALLFLVFLLTMFFVLGARLYYIQTVNAEWLVKRAQSLWERNETVDPERGIIFDRNGRELAYDAAAYTVIAYPDDIENPSQAASKLAPVLQMSEKKILQLITVQDKFQIELRNEGWKISSEVAEKVRSLDLPGIDLIEQRKRYYPANELAANVIGYTDKEGEAKLGIEHYYNEVLSGIPGSYRFKKDGKGYEIPKGIESYTPVSNGDDIVLTIDTMIQHIVEKALDVAEQTYHPKTMMAIVSKPETGEVLAMSVRPHFDPNKYWSFSSFGDFRNTSISYTFEPGSTFKIVTLAGAIEEGVFQPNAMYKSGRIQGDFGTIRDHNGGRGWGENQMITYLEGVQRSSNVAFVKMGYEGLGKERLYHYIDKFGFGKETGIDLPNEASGNFAKRQYARDVANVSFGQGVSVTAIQQVAAISAIANGGKLMKPYIVKEIRDEKTGKPIQVTKPTVLSQVISEETAQKTRRVLEKVVEDPIKGTGHRAYIEGYQVAGKTGTAQIIKDGQYLEDEYLVSFIGFAPADKPELVVYVMVEMPDIEGPYGGGSVAAPIFREIMLNSLRYLRINPQSEGKVMTDTAPEQKHQVPELAGSSIHLAQSRVKALQMSSIKVGNGTKVIAQIPKAGTETFKSQRIYLITEAIEKAPLPSLIGSSLRDALELCSIMEINCEVKGSGYVVDQSIPQGHVAYGRKLIITLQVPEGNTDHESPEKNTGSAADSSSDSENRSVSEGNSDKP
jgi:penicillin-binding protein 2B